MSLFCLGEFLIYTSFAGVILSIHIQNIYVCIYMFVHNIILFTLIFFVYVIQYNHWLYFVPVIFFYTSPAHALLHHCVFFTYTFELICL